MLCLYLWPALVYSFLTIWCNALHCVSILPIAANCSIFMLCYYYYLMLLVHYLFLFMLSCRWVTSPREFFTSIFDLELIDYWGLDFYVILFTSHGNWWLFSVNFWILVRNNFWTLSSAFLLTIIMFYTSIFIFISIYLLDCNTIYFPYSYPHINTCHFCNYWYTGCP